MSAHNLMTLIKRTSLNVYDADIFNCSRQDKANSESHQKPVDLRAEKGRLGLCAHLQRKNSAGNGVQIPTLPFFAEDSPCRSCRYGVYQRSHCKLASLLKLHDR